MSMGLLPEQIRLFRSMCADEQRGIISGMSWASLLSLDADFEIFGHDSQTTPPGEGWRVWLMMAGRGFGKTRAGSEWVNKLAAGRSVRIALVGATLDEARSVMVEGASGILSVARKRKAKVKWEPSLRRLTWPSGSTAELYSGDNADGLRGPEHEFAWFDQVDVPPDPDLVGYRIAVAGSSSSAEWTVTETQLLVGAAELAGLGAGPFIASARQVGAVGVSRPATIKITA